MSGLQVIFFGLSLAFIWVEIFKIGKVKPFNCLTCMTGWCSLIVAIIFKTDYFYMYLPAGVFVGALFGVIKMRYL